MRKAYNVFCDTVGGIAAVAVISPIIAVPTAVTVWAVKWILIMLGVTA